MKRHMGFTEVWQSAGRHVALKQARTSHKETLSKEVLNACLIVADPRGPRNRRVERPVELFDLASTVLELAGVDESQRRHAYGESLLPLLRGRGDECRRTFAAAETRDATALVTDRYKYIETPDGPVLFDLAVDPDERINAAAGHEPLCRESQGLLMAWRDEHGPVIPSPATSRASKEDDG